MSQEINFLAPLAPTLMQNLSVLGRQISVYGRLERYFWLILL